MIYTSRKCKGEGVCCDLNGGAIGRWCEKFERVLPIRPFRHAKFIIIINVWETRAKCIRTIGIMSRKRRITTCYDAIIVALYVLLRWSGCNLSRASTTVNFNKRVSFPLSVSVPRRNGWNGDRDFELILKKIKNV